MKVCIRKPIFYAALIAASVAGTAAISFVSHDLAYPSENRHATPQMIEQFPDLF